MDYCVDTYNKKYFYAVKEKSSFLKEKESTVTKRDCDEAKNPNDDVDQPQDDVLKRAKQFFNKAIPPLEKRDNKKLGSDGVN